ncbi:serine/threonine-protein kinase [Amnibacterium setariae]|uniref:Serine/threonine protein kinase n=1 Tax=Amnibacterium setariae TaxID=2306585 RepID=A0A3A1TXS1_9MICO|nr:serine/threonine-protein kinase [Amnibacterium setariae]RIX28371.1 serine/threonine protein kinase [Amnibacterium setariae]
MTELFAGRYAFVDLLGSGGMGTVWRVWDAKRREYAAAKLLSRSDSTSLLRFIRESSWRVEHDHVVTPTGWAAEDDRVLFTMPLVRGGTVADLVRDFGALPLGLVLDLLDQLLAALTAVHAAGLVHRDVKPSNLLLEPPGSDRPRLRLSDFGIAAHVDDPRLTRIGEAVGTRGYAAPEVLRGADPDPAQDVYAVGVLAAELVTGRRPGAGASGLGDHPLAALVAAMTEDDPGRRPTAGGARRTVAGLTAAPGPERGGDPVEVFDHVPELPDGWAPDGPVPLDDAGTPVPVPAPASEARPEPEPEPAAVQAATRPAPTRPAATRILQEPGPDTEPLPPAMRPVPRRRGTGWLPLAVVLLLVGAVSLIGGAVLLLR